MAASYAITQFLTSDTSAITFGGAPIPLCSYSPLSIATFASQSDQALSHDSSTGSLRLCFIEVIILVVFRYKGSGRQFG